MVYAGPTTGEANKYSRNMRFFQDHGLPCSHHAPAELSYQVTIAVVLTAASNAKLGAQLRAAAEADRLRCGATLSEVVVLVRDDRCYDMMAARTALVASGGGGGGGGGKGGGGKGRGGSSMSALAARADRIVFVNCGMLGPLLDLDLQSPRGPGKYWAEQVIGSSIKFYDSMRGVCRVGCMGPRVSTIFSSYTQVWHCSMSHTPPLLAIWYFIALMRHSSVGIEYTAVQTSYSTLMRSRWWSRSRAGMCRAVPRWSASRSIVGESGATSRRTYRWVDGWVGGSMGG